MAAACPQVMPDMSNATNSHHNEMLVPLHRRNYILGIINGIMVQVGNRLADPMTVLPLLLIRLSGVTWMVGLLQAIIITAPAAPAIFASRFVDTAEHKLPIFIRYSIIRFAALMGMALAVLAGGYLSGVLVATLLLLFFASWYTAQAVSTMAFMDIVAKSTPTTKRGSFWMWRQTIGLFLVLTVAVPLIHYLLGDNSPAPFPVNYGILLLTTALILGGSWVVYSQTHEPHSEPSGDRLTVRQNLVRGLRFWREDPKFRRMMRVYLLLTAVGAIGPFFMALAVQRWHFPDTVAATFVTVQIIAQMAGSIFQGRASDRWGNRRVFITAAFTGLIMALAATLGAVFAPAGGLELFGYPVSYRLMILSVCFAGGGVYIAHTWPGFMNYLMDIAPQQQRPSYVGFAHLFVVPVGIVPVIFGWLAEAVGFQVVFAIAIVLAAIAVILSLRINEPRDQLTAEQLHNLG